LTVHVADCVPILLYGVSLSDPCIAAVHAGWRGCRDGVLVRAIKTLLHQGIEASNIFAYL